MQKGVVLKLKISFDIDVPGELALSQFASFLNAALGSLRVAGLRITNLLTVKA
jgi:hypothetical protein